MRLFFLLRFSALLPPMPPKKRTGDGAQPPPSAKPAAKQRKEAKDDAATLELTPRYIATPHTSCPPPCVARTIHLCVSLPLSSHACLRASPQSVCLCPGIRPGMPSPKTHREWEGAWMCLRGCARHISERARGKAVVRERGCLCTPVGLTLKVWGGLGVGQTSVCVRG